MTAMMKMFCCVIVFIKLLLIDLCLCEDEKKSCAERFFDLRESLLGTGDTGETLFLLSSNDSQHVTVNNLFINVVDNYLGAKVKIVPDFCPEDAVKATEITAKYFKNVINLRVTNNYNTDNANIVYAGHADEYDTQMRLCSDGLSMSDNTLSQPDKSFDNLVNGADHFNPYYTSDIPGENVVIPNILHRVTRDKVAKAAQEAKQKLKKTLFSGDIYEDLTENTASCKIVTAKVPGVKLITKSVAKNQELHDIIKKISRDYDIFKNGKNNDETSIKDLKENYIVMSNIVICSENFLKLYNNDILWFENTTNKKSCDVIENYFEQNLLAVLAPKPLEREDRTLIPVLFYDTPYLLPEEKDMYPNSVLLDNNYNKVLKHALMKFIRIRKWYRIAIISDDSPFSDEFEKELTMLFDQYAVVYTVKQCRGKICDFTEALTSLQNAESKIIIANVDVKYSEILADTVARQNMKSEHGYVWIWRGWPFRTDDAASIMGKVYSIYVAPDTFKQVLYPPHHHHHRADLDDINYGKILKSLMNVKPLLTSYNAKQSRSEFYRNISKLIKSNIRSRPQVDVHVRRVNNGKGTVIFSVSGLLPNVENNFVIMKNKGVIMKSDLNGCVIRSTKFYDPCDDKKLFSVTLVIFVFLVTLIVIYTFFDRYSRRRRGNYTNL